MVMSLRHWLIVFFAIINFGIVACAMSWDVGSDASSDLPVDIPENCGNGVINLGSEECDTSEFGGKTCESLGYGPGSLVCRANCTIDTSGCGGGATCGDDICAPEETPCTCPADCGPCPGCCDDAGMCLDGTDDRYCGSSGAACAACTGDTSCIGGACLSECGNTICDGLETQCTCPEDCGPCTGCCQAAECFSGSDEAACGHGGIVCDVCSDSEACVDGSCMGGCGNGVCGSGETECNCPEDCGVCAGCCEASECKPGNLDTACGSSGEVCDICADSERCSGGDCLGGCGNSVCGSGETECNCPEDCGGCAGCCSGSACQAGSSDSACGSGGEVCEDCGAGERCAGGTCEGGCGNTMCGPGENECNCPDDCGTCAGCCSGDSCLGGTSTSACGTGGESCDSCTGGEVCQGGDCTCVSHDHRDCYDGDVYWFDSCNNREGLAEDCGTFGCSGGACGTDCHGGRTVGDPDYCRSDCQCGEDEGDCDSSSECSGVLTCADNIGPAFGWSSNTDVCSPCQNDVFEWNQEKSDAGYVGTYADTDDTTYYYDHLDIWPSSDEDWFYGYVTDELFGELSLRMNLTSLSVDLDICVTYQCDVNPLLYVNCNSDSDWKSGDDTCCSSESGTTSEQVLLDPHCDGNGDGTFYIRIYGFSGSTQCNYYLDMKF